MELEKISHMGAERGPRKMIVVWMMNDCPCSHPQQTIRHGLASMLMDHLDLPSPKMNNWFKLAFNHKDHKDWSEHIETKLGLLAPSTNKPHAKCPDTNQTI
jgi:hypothetical protein